MGPPDRKILKNLRIWEFNRFPQKTKTFDVNRALFIGHELGLQAKS